MDNIIIQTSNNFEKLFARREGLLAFKNTHKKNTVSNVMATMNIYQKRQVGNFHYLLKAAQILDLSKIRSSIYRTEKHNLQTSIVPF